MYGHLKFAHAFVLPSNKVARVDVGTAVANDDETFKQKVTRISIAIKVELFTRVPVVCKPSV